MAVYTEVNDQALNSFLIDYDIGSVVSFKGIAEGVENTNYLLQTDKGQFILTLYEKRVDQSDLPFFLNLMQHLAMAGLKCPVPVAGKDGIDLRVLCGRPAAIITFLKGVCPVKIFPHHCTEVGRCMALMHKAGMSYGRKRENSLSLKGWYSLYDAVQTCANDFSSGLSSDLGHELTSLKSCWPVGLPEGIIHADLFPDNVFFLNEECSGLIDFYFSCHDFLAYDIAIGVNAWCFDGGSTLNIESFSCFIEGYESVRKLSENEKNSLPVLLRGAALRFLLTRLYDWGNTPDNAIVQPKNPIEYLNKLKFHQSVKTIKEYGL